MKTIFLFSLVTLITKSAFAQWVQLGTALTGDHTNHFFGFKVELDQTGDHAIVGAPDNYGLGGNGTAQVFQYSGGFWIQKGSTLTGSVGDNFGFAVDISDDANTVVVGADLNSTVATNAGKVKVYEWSGTNWIQKGSDLLGQSLEDRFGFSTSFNADGDILAIGAPQWYYFPQGPGYTKVFEWDGAAWVQKGSTITGDVAGDMFGFRTSLSDSGDTLAISAVKNNGSAGQVKIYTWDGMDWAILGSPIQGSAANDLAGVSIDLTADGSTICIGASEHDNYAGQARVFSFDGSNWVQKGIDIDSDTVSTSLGQSSQLADDGNRIIVGQAGYDGLPWSQGRVSVYDWDGSSWVQNADYIKGEEAQESFGSSTAISGDGKVIAAGTPSKDLSNGDQGYVKIYHITGSGMEEINREDQAIKLYPVPATDKITLEIPLAAGNCEYKIYDITGKIVLTGYANGIVTLDICTLEPGIFAVQVIGINSAYTAREIIQKW
jgi:hypothetical protein